MKTKDQTLLEEAYHATLLIIENKKQAQQLVDQGKLSGEDFDRIVAIDQTPTKKFTGWLAKQWSLGQVTNPDEAKSVLDMFNKLASTKKIKQTDIQHYKTFQDLKAELDKAENIGAGITNKQMQGSFEVIRDDEDLLIVSPYTHAACRKLGQSQFAFREHESEDSEAGDSAWCVTFKNPKHFNEYYYIIEDTFYFIKVRSARLLQQLKKQGFGLEYSIVAVKVPDQEGGERESEKEAYDGNDENFLGKELNKYLNTINVSPSMLVPRRLKERQAEGARMANQIIQKYIDNGSKGDLDLVGMPVTMLPNKLAVNGDLLLQQTKVNALPRDLKISGDLYVGESPLFNLKRNDKRLPMNFKGGIYQ
jgi:hypothetical protein